MCVLNSHALAKPLTLHPQAVGRHHHELLHSRPSALLQQRHHIPRSASACLCTLPLLRHLLFSTTRNRTRQPPPCTGGINVYGSNSSSTCAVYDGHKSPDGYFPLQGNCLAYNGPPYLTSTTYSTFIGIAW